MALFIAYNKTNVVQKFKFQLLTYLIRKNTAKTGYEWLTLLQMLLSKCVFVFKPILKSI